MTDTPEAPAACREIVIVNGKPELHDDDCGYVLYVACDDHCCEVCCCTCSFLETRP